MNCDSVVKSDPTLRSVVVSDSWRLCRVALQSPSDVLSLEDLSRLENPAVLGRNRSEGFESEGYEYCGSAAN